MHGIMVNAVSTTTRSLSLTCPDVTDVGGNTPLDLAKLFVRTRSLSLTCPDVTDDLAVRSGHTEIVDYLQSLQPSTPEPGMCH